jgi:hypothetical protein
VLTTLQMYQRKERVYNGTVHQILMNFMKGYDSIKREVLCNILTEFGTSMKLARLFKICLN